MPDPQQEYVVRLTADELATAKTLIDLAKRFLPPHITEQEQAREARAFALQTNTDERE